MKTNKSIFILLLTLNIFLLYSCKSTLNIPDKIDWSKVPNFKSTKNNIEEVEKINIDYANDTVSRVKLNDLMDNINKNIPSEIVDKVKNQAEKIYFGAKKTNDKLNGLKNKLEKIKKKLNPDLLTKRTDSLYSLKIKQRNKQYKKIPIKIRDEILNEIIAENNEYIININKTVVAINEEQITLVSTLKTHAFMLLKLKEGSNFVENVSLSAEQNNFFETGSFELKELELRKALVDLKNVLIKMTDKLEDLKEKSRINSNLNAKLIFHINGYSDSTPFKQNSYENNRILSQKRADYIAIQLKNLCDEYFKNYKTEFISFQDCEIIANGYGEDLPPNLNKNEVKNNDPRRRMIKVIGYIEIE